MDEDSGEPMEIDDTVPTSQIITNENPTISIGNAIGNAEEDVSSNKDNTTPPVNTSVTIDDKISDDKEIAPITDKPSSTTTTDTTTNKPPVTSTDSVVILDDDEEDEALKTQKVPPETISKPSNDKVVDEVIDLIPKSINSKCINYSCKSGKNLIAAPGFCLSFYRVKCTGKSNKEVCKECYDIAIAEFELLVNALTKNNSLLNVKVPLRNETVEIEDSDEECDDSPETNYIDQETYKFIEDNIEDVLEETLNKISFSERFDDELEGLKINNNRMKDSLEELQNEIKKTRLTLDEIQLNLYNEFRVDSVESQIVTIIDDPTESVNFQIQIENPKGSNNQRKSTRNISKIVNQLKPISDTSTNIEKPSDLPDVGLLVKAPAKVGEIYYITRENQTGSWIRARLINILPIGTLLNTQITETPYYKLIELKKQKERIVNGKSLAYINPSSIRLEMGTRVIAVMKDTNDTVATSVRNRHDLYYSGVIGEPAVEYNRFRYLVFFDIGYSQYVNYKLVNVVLESSKYVWEDTHINSQPFIKKYLESKDRPMVKLSIGQTVKVEYNGKWLQCSVEKIDCSLMQVRFNSLNRTEWIYRGSSRLRPMYEEEMAANSRQTRNTTADKSSVVHHNNTSDFKETAKIEPSSPEESKNTETVTSTARAVARKSTTRLQNNAFNSNSGGVGVPFLPPQVSNQPANQQPQQHIVTPGPTTKIMYFTPRDQLITQRLYRRHLCSIKCKDYIRTDYNKLRGHNPLSKPLLCGWARLTVKLRHRKDIIYKAPCGRMLRNLAEVHQYLRLTNSDMTVDLFDFNQTIRCLAEFNVECPPDPKDLSKGLEQVPIPVINGINNAKLDFSNYSIQRVPMEDVPLNTDPEFLCGCDCEDDCVDKSKCACWKMTLEGAKFLGKNVDPNTIGYIYRRLPEPVVTGIYECNSRCKCSKVTCLNRVVQHPMSLKLQVFRTFNRGWGIRAVNDVPQGSFICVYAGTIHTEQMANEDGVTFGDEYFAELDYIEICEQYKQDYESEVIEPDQRSETSSVDLDDDEPDKRTPLFNKKKSYYNDDNDFVPSNPFTDKTDNRIRERLRRRNANDTNENDNSRSSDDNYMKITPIKIKRDDSYYSENSSTSDLNNFTIIDTVTISDDEDDPKEMLNFNPKAEIDQSSTSVRTLFGKDEAVYVMDAKNAGNIGRFLNHSCSPNVFVQNVFVDTHDVRFPCVAFFSSQFIRAGTELTWNYNYDIGSVPGKVLYCHCSSLECKGRLL